MLFQLSQTNDSNAVALTCRSLYKHIIPLMYTRFDIVWPDDEAEPEDAPGNVDALTYGLSTLSMSGDDRSEAVANYEACPHCGQAICHQPHNNEQQFLRSDSFRLVNDYAQYIRKFSIGNGPPQYIRDYTADKERGKMLNTLVARAVMNSQNLENFVWDMPTGLTREVWIALASLKRRRDAQHCRLKRVWIRMHDPRLVVYEPWPRQVSNPSPPHPPGSTLPTGNNNNTQLTAAPYPPFQFAHTAPEFQSPSRPTNGKNVAYPNRTFSLLCPLQSLNVMEIDAPEFLYEMSDLISRSIHCLKELRVSLATFISNKTLDWKEVWEGEDAPDPYEAFNGTRTRSQKRAGGVLGTLFGRFFSVKEYERALAFTNDRNLSADSAACEERLTKLNSEFRTVSVVAHKSPSGTEHMPVQFEIHSKKLSLEKLELSFITLSISVLTGVVDWTKLTSLTLMCCSLSDLLWLHLKRSYAPKPSVDGGCHSQLEYPLALREVRTDSVSTVFLKFVTDALSPNSLRSLHLRDRHPSQKQRPVKVTLKQIFKGPLRRHATSLERLSIDSAPRKTTNGFLDSKKDSAQYQQWLASRDVLAFITSSAMPKLQELCLSIQYKDWHYFLRRLVKIPHLQVLYIPVLHHDGQLQNCQKSDSEDLAYQVADAISFRPEISLSYFANHNRCFEIFESRSGDMDTGAEDDRSPTNWMNGTAIEHSDEEDVDVDGADEVTADDDSEADTGTDNGSADSEDDGPDNGDGWKFDGGEEKDRIVFAVRDTLFPDSKAEVFKFRKPEL